MNGRIPCLLALSCAAVAWGCASDDGRPDAGPAFPDRRVAFVPVAGHALGYVANRYSDTVSVLDLTSMQALAEVAVGIDPVEIDGPCQLTLDRAGQSAYVVMTYPLSVSGPHAIAHGAKPPFGRVRLLSLAELAPLGDVAMDRHASSLALAIGGGLLAVAHFDEELAGLSTGLETRRANLTLVDMPQAIATGLAVRRKGPVCVAPLGAVLSRDGTRAFVACNGEDQLAVVDTASLAVLARVPAGDAPANAPTAIVIDPGGARVVLSNRLTRRVVAFQADDAAAELGSSAELPGAPGPVAFLSATEWLIPLRAPDGAARVDAASGAVLGYASYAEDECQTPNTATVTATGVFLVCEGDHEGPGAVVRLDPVTLAVQARLPIGRFPDALAVVEPDGRVAQPGAVAPP